MKNFKVIDKDTKKEYWISRSNAVTVAIVAIDDINKNGNVYYLAEKRGPGCPDNVGKMCMCCGYLDWDETRKQAAVREVYEELGLRINEGDLKEYETVDDPADNPRQNITTRYIIYFPYSELKQKLESGEINTDTVSRGGESGEVDGIELILIDDIDNYEWAWSHGEVIKRMYGI